MYAPLRVEVASVGEDVSLTVGTWSRRLHFETAVMLAAWMDECAREAKAWTGTRRRFLRGHGVLHDASNPNWINEGQPFTPNGVPRVNRDLLKVHSIEVKSEAGTVVLIAGTAQMAMPWEAALRISQWVRVRAKESQTRAGDTSRHWSRIRAAFDWLRGARVTRG